MAQLHDILHIGKSEPGQVGEHSVQRETVKEKFCSVLAERISQNLELKRLYFRKNQSRSLERLCDALKQNRLKVLIKAPPGAGKTRVFSEVIFSSREGGLILLPQHSLNRDTVQTLKAAGLSEDAIFVIKPNSSLSAGVALENALQKIGELSDQPWAILMNKSSFVSIERRESLSFAKMLEAVRILVLDEAHTVMGVKTKQAISVSDRTDIGDVTSNCLSVLLERKVEVQNALRAKMESFKQGEWSEENVFKFALSALVIMAQDKEWSSLPQLSRSAYISKTCKELEVLLNLRKHKINVDEAHNSPEKLLEKISIGVVHMLEQLFLDLREEQILRAIDKHSVPHLQIFCTATPESAFKNVKDEYGIVDVDSTRIQELVEDGCAVLPKRICVGTAVYKTDEPHFRVNKASISRLCIEERFVMEDGTSVRSAVTNMYLHLRERSKGYLPAVAFCKTIHEAEEVRKLLLSEGIRAVRCTSGNRYYEPGVDTDEVKKLMEKCPDDPERIEVVCTVGQVGIGWDVRTLRAALWYRYDFSPINAIQNNGRIMRSLLPNDPWPDKTEETYIIEPSWRIRKAASSPFVEKSDERKQSHDIPGGSLGRNQELHTSKSALEVMLELSEIDLEYALEKGVLVKNLPFNFREESHLRVLIGDAGKLCHLGLPIDITELSFNVRELGWQVSGLKLWKLVCPEIKDPTLASRFLARTLWPEEADKLFIDPGRDDDLRALIGSPVNLMKTVGEVIDSLEVRKFSNREKGWEADGDRLSLLLYGRSSNAGDVKALLERLWPLVIKDSKLDYKNRSHIRTLLLRSPRLLHEDIFLHEFSYAEKNWVVSGRHLALMISEHHAISAPIRLLGRLVAREFDIPLDAEPTTELPRAIIASGPDKIFSGAPPSLESIDKTQISKKVSTILLNAIASQPGSDADPNYYNDFLSQGAQNSLFSARDVHFLQLRIGMHVAVVCHFGEVSTYALGETLGIAVQQAAKQMRDIIFRPEA